jgi:bla regulator protein BlaR1
MESLLLECAVRAALIATGTAVVLWAMRIKMAATRHAAWTAVVVAMLLLPIWSAAGLKVALRVLRPMPSPIGIAADPANVIPAAALPGTTLPDPPAGGDSGRGMNWHDVLVGLYLLGASVLLARLAVGTVRARRLRRGAVIEAGRLTSERCATPITVGWLAPVLILPRGWQHWPLAQLDAVLTHEGEHARRHDPLVQWLALFNRAVFWFHPLAWWLERRLATLAEEACDAAVLAAGHSPQDYSDYLLDFARSVTREGRRVRVVAMAMPGSGLTERMRTILDGVPVQPISRTRVVCTAAFCAMSSVLFAAATLAPQPPSQVTQEQKPVAPAQKFDVASIKPCKPDDSPPGPARGGAGGTNASVSPGRMNVPCVTLEQLIYLAYAGTGATADERLVNDDAGQASDATKVRGGPAWVHSQRDKFAVEATAAGASDRFVLLGAMLRMMLEERFHLKVHRETEEVPMYTLAVAKGGFKLKPMKDGDCDAVRSAPFDFDAAKPPCNSMTSRGNGPNAVWTFAGFKVSALAGRLSRTLDRHVIDQTGIAGEYIVRLEFHPDENTPGIKWPAERDADTSVPPAASNFTALEQQMGLKIERTRAPRGFLVIDHVERPSPNTGPAFAKATADKPAILDVPARARGGR